MNRFRDKRKVISLTLVGVAYLLIVIPLIISNIQKQTALSGHAQTAVGPAQKVCNDISMDIMLVMDYSNSMQDKINTSQTKVQAANAAAKSFISNISKNTKNRIGLVTFWSKANLVSKLTSNYSSVSNALNTKTANGTCAQCGIDTANKEITTDGRTGTKKVVIFLTDGLANWIEGGKGYVSGTTAENAAIASVKTGNKASDTIFYTVGLGKDVNASFLKQIASIAGGKYYFTPTTDQLNQIYTQISQTIAKGSVSGVIFNDANGNGVMDPGEQQLGGWEVQISQQQGASLSSTSNSSGAYTIDGLCDGNYTLKEILQPGWTQTVPGSNNGYPITITNGSVLTNKNFGNKKEEPTTVPSPTPQETTMNMTVYLDGIGSRGDNTNPTSSSLSNKNPLHTKISADIEIYTKDNNLIASGPGTLTYDAANGDYTGTVPISTGFPTGIYFVKVKTHTHLRKEIDQIQTITAGANNTITPVSLVTGDINNDNVLNILDYNLLLNCYSDLTQAVDCPNVINKNDADLNDDGAVNQIDYNLFLRELATQPGQ